MIFTLTIDPATLETTCNDSSVVINFTKNEDGMILCEISKPDDETIQIMPGPGMIWQQ